mgnify:CR=1 FL=1
MTHNGNHILHNIYYAMKKSRNNFKQGNNSYKSETIRIAINDDKHNTLY